MEFYYYSDKKSKSKEKSQNLLYTLSLFEIQLAEHKSPEVNIFIPWWTKTLNNYMNKADNNQNPNSDQKFS